MTDIAIVFDPKRGIFDYAMDGPQLAEDDGLSTAIILSWFVNKRADSGDVLPQDQPGPFGIAKLSGGDRMGTWIDFMTAANVNILPGQAYPEPADRMGSKFWLYKRRKITAQLPLEIQGEAYDCLDWMIQDGLASSMTMAARVVGKQTILVQGSIQLAAGSSAKLLLPVIVGGGTWPLPTGIAQGQYGAIGVFVPG